jgi:hypothetical protein
LRSINDVKVKSSHPHRYFLLTYFPLSLLHTRDTLLASTASVMVHTCSMGTKSVSASSPLSFVYSVRLEVRKPLQRDENEADCGQDPNC